LKPLITLLALALLAFAVFAIVPHSPPDGPFSTALKYDGMYKGYPTDPVSFSSFTQVVETRVGGSSVVHKSPGATAYSNLTITLPTTGFRNDTSLRSWYDAPLRGKKDMLVEIRSGAPTVFAVYMFYISEPVSRRTINKGGTLYAIYTFTCNSFEKDREVVG